MSFNPSTTHITVDTSPDGEVIAVDYPHPGTEVEVRIPAWGEAPIGSVIKLPQVAPDPLLHGHMWIDPEDAGPNAYLRVNGVTKKIAFIA